MFDLVVKGGVLPDGRQADIGIRGDRIAAVEALPDGVAAGAVIDAAGDLVCPPFVDPHFHMDATLSYGIPRINASGTLLEGIALWGELKRDVTVEAMVARALTYCDWAASMGLLAIRSHVDVCDDRLLGVEALLEVREKVRDYIDLQLVAFPQDGLFRDPGAQANLIRALDRGVDVVGGIPHFERTMEDGARSVRVLCELAAERGLMVDLHCDETDDPLSRHVETLAHEAQRLGLQGRVAGSHLTSMHSMDSYYVSKLLPLMAEAGLAAIPNPLINIVLQGRHDGFPKRRGLTRVKEMQAHGIPVGWGAGLRARPVVFAGDGRHARCRLHGAACGADDEPCGDAARLRHGDRGQRPDHGDRGLWAGSRQHRLAGGGRCRRSGGGAAAAPAAAGGDRQGPGDCAPAAQCRDNVAAGPPGIGQPAMQAGSGRVAGLSRKSCKDRVLENSVGPKHNERDASRKATFRPACTQSEQSTDSARLRPPFDSVNPPLLRVPSPRPSAPSGYRQSARCDSRSAWRASIGPRHR
jgi:cytosine deaminase